MHKLLLAALLNLFFIVSNAAFLKDTTFISYEDFSRLSKNDIKQRFGKDDESKRLITDYYKHNRKGLKKLWGIIPLTAIGSYFAVIGSNATNGMGGTVGLVLAILFLLPASILLITLLASLSGRKKRDSKKTVLRGFEAIFSNKIVNKKSTFLFMLAKSCNLTILFLDE
jgi:hypothetical protein